MAIEDLLKFMVRQNASDLHIKPMRPPLLRLKGKLVSLNMEPLVPDLIKEMLYGILTEKQRELLEEEFYVEFGYSMPGLSRFRTSIYFQRGTLSAVFRRVPFEFPSIDDWGLPEIIKEFAYLPQGLVIVTGPAGSGKSSTLAALMKLISDAKQVHIVTIEDPIEFLIKDSLASVSQREVGTDTKSFHEALRNALRQDPDIIMVGEMRDLQTIATVLTAAETGHLVFSTLHTNSAAQTIDRIVDPFPAVQQRQVRQQLSHVLKGIISLKLVERADGSGLTASVEILKQTPKIQKLINEGNSADIEREIEGSVSHLRMQSMNQSLLALVLNKVITQEIAMSGSNNPDELDLILRKHLYPQQNKGDAGGDPMAESLADFSKIVELQEIKKLYQEQEEKHKSEMLTKEEQMAQLRDELEQTIQQQSGPLAEFEKIREERDHLRQQIELIRNEYQMKVEKLQNRIRELTQFAGK
jgi:twitching motility protein PilT